MRPSDYSTTQRLAVVALGIFASLTTAGVIFGFQALRPALIADGVFGWLCGENDLQLLRLNLMFAIASTGANVASLPIGIFLDRYGPRATVLTGSILFALGGLLFGLSSQKFDMFIPGYLLLGIGGPFCFIGSLHLSLTFPSRSGLIMAALTGAFDASSSIYFLFEGIHQHVQQPIQHFFLFYCAIPATIFILTTLLMPSSPFDNPTLAEEVTSSSDTLDERSSLLPPTNNDNNDDDERRKGNAQSSGRLLKRQLGGVEFWGITTTICIYMLRLNFYISSIEEQISDLDAAAHNPSEVQTIVNFFNIGLPLGGIVSIPFIGYLLDNYRLSTSFAVLWVTGVGYGVLGLIPVVPLQYATVTVFAVMRPLLYTL
ncbi:hypothetical protein HK097_003812, partial [Rhizophlyctis rosea]